MIGPKPGASIDRTPSLMTTNVPATAAAIQMSTAALARGMDEDFSGVINFMPALAAVERL